MMLTNVAIDLKLDLRVVSPYNAVDHPGRVLKEEPEAQEGDSKIPALSDEARREHQQQTCRRESTSAGI